MFVLLSLIVWCLRCVFAPLLSMNQPIAQVKRAQHAINTIASSKLHCLAPIHAPNTRLTV